LYFKTDPPPESDFMTYEKRCDNCIFSTFAIGSGRAVLLCRQKKGSVGNYTIRPLDHNCPNFHPSRAASAKTPRIIPLTRGKFAIVDAADYPTLTRYTWFADYSRKIYYASRKENGNCIKMHRQILSAPDDLVVDHIDHDSLNNTRSNLRLATIAQNCQNRRSLSQSSSEYKGVYWNKDQEKWAAQIQRNKKNYFLGYFKNQTDAAKAYDKKAKQLFRQFAYLNFPPDV
jgi:hypothetical protein